MLDVFLAIALVWALYLVVAAHRARQVRAREHVWGEFSSAQIARMQRKPERR